MASRLPTLAFKRVRVPGRHVIFALLGVGAYAAFLISTPWVTLGVSGLAYLASIPYAWVVFQRKRKLGEALGETEAAAADPTDNDRDDIEGPGDLDDLEG